MHISFTSLKKTILTAAIAIAFASPTLAATDDIKQRSEASRTVIKAFFTDLKKQLVSGLKAGGPVEAIGSCNVSAPAIAGAHSNAQGRDIGRTSLKLRNPANEPDAWELGVLKDFEARKANGENPAKMETAAYVEEDGKKVFRYMKAIPTAEKPCLACHGGKIAPEVAAKLDELYPDDKARGYMAGDIRGAFTIKQYQ